MQNLSTYRHSDSVYRSCSRCHRELTDSASREAGVGPVCRKKNNLIMSKTIPANLGMASILLLDLKPSSFHECVSEELENIKSKFFKKVQQIQKTNDDITAVTLRGGDFREIVDWFDYALSFPCSGKTREFVINIIDNLGYQALAGILKGDVCMSKAKLYVADGKVYLQGKSNKSGWLAMRKNISGVKTPRYRGDTTPYSASVDQVERFIEIAFRYWPFVEAEREEVILEAKNSAKNPAAPEKQVVDDSLTAKIDVYQTNFFVHVPWMRGDSSKMYEMLNKFKKVPKAERSFDPLTKKWKFEIKHFEAIRNVITKEYEYYLVEKYW